MSRRQLAALLALALLALLVVADPPRGTAASPAGAPAGAAEGAVLAEGQGADQAVANWYRGKTIRFVVGYAAGGGFDTYTRAIARHFGRYVPGTPNVIVDNMPGAGSLIAANYTYAVARPDGLTIGNWIGTLLLAQVLGGPGIEFDGRRFGYVGVPTPDNNVCAVRRDSGFRSFSDAIGSPQPLILGGLAPGTPNDDAPKVLTAALGMNLRLVSGYSGTATLRQAADNGEVMGGCWAWESIKVTWRSGLESGEVIVIGRVNAAPIADLPNIESALDMAPTEEARQLITSGVIVPGRISRIYAVHPGTPAERLQALRQAFLAVFQDPAFLEDVQRAGLEIDPLGGDQVERLAHELFDTPEAIKARLRAILVGS